MNLFLNVSRNLLLTTLLQVKDASKVWYFNPKLIVKLEMTVEQDHEQVTFFK